MQTVSHNLPALADPVMSGVRSQDGTTIAYERSGSGGPIIVVDGALCSRAFGPSQKLAPLLAQRFTVFTYDRRGRGASGDAPQYSAEREVEDIAALLQEAGGGASLLGLSSGGALALEAAASGLAVTEPWDIGMRPRPVEPATRRYMILRKATQATESGAAPAPAERTELSRLLDETTHTGTRAVAETMRPSRRGRRYKNSRNGVTVMDGPFVETKELLAGYVIVSAASLDEAGQWAMKYLDVVEADEVDVRELE